MWRNEVGAVGRSCVWSQSQPLPVGRVEVAVLMGVKCSGCPDVEMGYSRLEKTELDPGKHMLPPGIRRDSGQGCHITRVRADQKEKPNKALPET